MAAYKSAVPQFTDEKIAMTVATILLFLRVRPAAALLMLPYLAWLGFAAWLNHEIEVLNPNASSLAAPAVRTQI